MVGFGIPIARLVYFIIVLIRCLSSFPTLPTHNTRLNYQTPQITDLARILVSTLDLFIAGRQYILELIVFFISISMCGVLPGKHAETKPRYF